MPDMPAFPEIPAFPDFPGPPAILRSRAYHSPPLGGAGGGRRGSPGSLPPFLLPSVCYFSGFSRVRENCLYYLRVRLGYVKEISYLCSVKNNVLLNIAIRAALEAGAEELRIYHLPAEQQEVELKVDQSPLTLADRRAHEIICSHLAETGLPILSEEGRHLPHSERKEWQNYWCVDPLDGTKEFVKHSGEFSVNIALMERAADGSAAWVPTLGVVFFPATGALYYTAGEEAYRAQVTDGTDIGQITRLPEHMQRPYTVVASVSHMNADTEAYIQTLREAHPDLQLIQGGSSLKLCRVAEGSADIYPRLGPTCEWDTAAAHAVVRAAGGDVTSHADGLTLRYNKADLLNPYFIVELQNIN